MIYSFLAKFLNKFRKDRSMWSGDYSSWAEANQFCIGYSSDLILSRCSQAILKVKNGEAVYERDSVIFDQVEYSWGLLAGLQKIALENNRNLNVLDFGGSLGSTYYQNRNFLSPVELTWNIVEQANFVDFGKLNIQDSDIRFYHSVEECLKENKPDVLLLSGVLQYLESPNDWIKKFIALGIPNIIIDRTAFIASGRDIITIQNVPKDIYEASYPAWFFVESVFESRFLESYDLIAKFESPFERTSLINKLNTIYWNGFILKRKLTKSDFN